MSEMIETQIRDFIIERFPSASKRTLDSQAALLENGIIDSLGVLELVSFIEGKFAITVADEELMPENFKSIERISLFVKCKRNGKKGS